MRKYLVHEDAPLDEALTQISNNKCRIVFVVTGDGRLVGSLSDGDIRRWLTKQSSVSLGIASGEIANRDCKFLRKEDELEISTFKFSSRVEMIPIVNERMRVCAIGRDWIKDFEISGRLISKEERVFIIAEIGINHNGSVDLSRRLIDAVAESGADCAKFQMRHLPSLYRKGKSGIHSEDLGAQYTIDLLNECQLGVDELLSCLSYASERGLIPLCTPWDLHSARILIDYGLPAFKVASADLTNHELIESVMESGMPVILSTGMSTEGEIQETTSVLQGGQGSFALLHCNSAYPSPFRDVRLAYMERLREIGGCHVGYSSHERGHHVPLAAVALGARIIEKHITVDRNARGIDHAISLEPPEFSRMVKEIREVEDSMGDTKPRIPTQGEQLNRLSLAKSLVAIRDLPEGHEVSRLDIAVQSPGRGLQPNALRHLLGKVLTRPVYEGDFFYDSDLYGRLPQARPFYFARPWGLPVRFHDVRELVPKSNPDFLEFHLSFRDLEVDIAKVVTEPFDCGLVVHSPDLFDEDLLLDLASDDLFTLEKSKSFLQQVIDLSLTLKECFQQTAPVPIVVSMGGSSFDSKLPKQRRPFLYERINASIQSLDLTGVTLLAQTLPPYPWYLGGQRYCNLFVEPEETASFSETYSIPLCLDISHTKLACNSLKLPFHEAIEVLAPQSQHLHLVDAAGLDAEGLQVGEGEVDWAALCGQLDRLAVGVSFIPEVWQGHIAGGQGFWIALDRLEHYFNRDHKP